MIHAWATSKEGHGIERAHNILLEMKQLRDSGKRPDLVPDEVAFTSIVSALAQNSQRRNTEETQQILETMLDFVKDEGVGLDTPAYNALIHAQSKQKGSVAMVEELLNHLLDQDISTKIRPVSFYSQSHSSFFYYTDIVFNFSLLGCDNIQYCFRCN